jgi:hypothetical protein
MVAIVHKDPLRLKFDAQVMHAKIKYTQKWKLVNCFCTCHGEIKNCKYNRILGGPSHLLEEPCILGDTT